MTVNSNTPIDLDLLFQQATEAALSAYAPYSGFRVGSAILCQDGKIFTGCNVENRSFGLTICAERNALAQAVHKGVHGILAITVATPDSRTPVSPCGACRQVLTEFGNADTLVRFGCTSQNYIDTTLGQLFPFDALTKLAEDMHHNNAT